MSLDPTDDIHVMDGNEPLPESVFAPIYVTIWRH